MNEKELFYSSRFSSKPTKHTDLVVLAEHVNVLGVVAERRAAMVLKSKFEAILTVTFFLSVKRQI